LDRDGNARRMPLTLSRDLARMLAANGWASMRFDKRGVGSSSGDYLRAGFYDEMADAEAVLAWLGSRPEVSTVVVIGHSVGATMASELAVRHDAIDGVVMLSATAQTGENTLTWQAARIAPTLPAPARALLRLMRTDVLRQQRKAIDRIMRTDGDVERIQGAKINARWMREFITYDPAPTLRRLRVPVLAMTGSKDVQVDPADVHAVADLAQDVEAHVIEDVDHILRHEPREVSNVRRYRKQVAQPIDATVERLLLDWLQRCGRAGPSSRAARRNTQQDFVNDSPEVRRRG
jgi:pimeloyl-ACP methyl ester carboxylesterase